MLKPSYKDLMDVANENVKEGEERIVNSRYSIVMAASKRARQIALSSDPALENRHEEKPLSIAIEELNNGTVKIISAEEAEERASKNKA